MSVQWAVLTVVGLAVGVVVLAVLGFRVRPPRARPVADGPPIGTVELSRDLPEPVARYHRALGFDGHGRMRIGARSVTGPEIDQGENLFLWAELLLVPAVLAARPQVRWQTIDADSALLRVPFGRDSDRLMVRFDPDTGLLSQCRALRYRSIGGPKIGWYVWFERWTHGPAGWYPARISVRWADHARPWFVLDVDGLATNVPIDPDLKVGSPGQDTSDGPTPPVPTWAALKVQATTGRGAQ